MRTFLLDYRCSCGYLLFKGLLLDARLEIKCKRCGTIQVINDHFARTTDKQFALVFNSEGKVVDSSVSALSILGYTREDLHKLNTFDIAPHATTEHFKTMWERTRNMSFTPFIVESFVKTKSGKMITVRARTMFPILKKEVFMLALCEVISRDQNFKYKPDLVTKNLIIQDLMMEVNTQGYIIGVSNELLQQLGYTIFETVGRPMFDFMPKEEISKFKYEFNLMSEGRQSFFVKNNQFLTKSGKVLQYDTNYAVTFYDTNELKGFRVSCISMGDEKI